MKVGDTVRIKTNLKELDDEEIGIAPEMFAYEGAIAHIVNVTEGFGIDNVNLGYLLDIDNEDWVWSENWLENIDDTLTGYIDTLASYLKDKIEKIPAGLMKYFNNLKEVYDDLKEKLSFNQSLLEVERIILLMEKDYQLYPFESFVSELKIHYSKEYFILMKLLEIVMKDCQEAKLGRETVKLTLSLMMNQKLRLKIFGF